MGPDTLEALQRDPLAFVLGCFRWGEGELTDCAGPREWQRRVLEDIGQRIQSGAATDEAIRIATASGHGIGKSALVAMLILWALVTRIDTRGVVTANTEKQLTTKTWPELAKWHRLCILGDSFTFTATSLYSADTAHEKTWRVDAIPWSLNNTEAFAGLHNKDRRVLVIFDEASAIADEIWEVTEGALTDADTEIMWLAFGNPTRNSGRFAECFGRQRHRWATRQIDSRSVEGTNLKQLQAWVDDYGEDSDFVRVRVRGVFPRAGTMQFIGRDLVDEAMARELPERSGLRHTALVGVDVARFGADQSVIRTRMGRDARTWPPKKYRNVDTMQLAALVGEHINELKRLGLRRVLVFVDGGGVGGGVVDRLTQLGHDVIEVQFGGKADNPRDFANKAAEMWHRGREWLKVGCIDRDEDLAAELTGREYSYTTEDKLQLERKEMMFARGLSSPDDADALMLTFAHPAMEIVDAPGDAQGSARFSVGQRARHDPFARNRLIGR